MTPKEFGWTVLGLSGVLALLIYVMIVYIAMPAGR
jgi:hypothetical protein